MIYTTCKKSKLGKAELLLYGTRLVRVLPLTTKFETRINFTVPKVLYERWTRVPIDKYELPLPVCKFNLVYNSVISGKSRTESVPVQNLLVGSNEFLRCRSPVVQDLILFLDIPENTFERSCADFVVFKNIYIQKFSPVMMQKHVCSQKFESFGTKSVPSAKFGYGQVDRSPAAAAYFLIRVPACLY